MPNPSRERQLTTKDDVPLHEILDYGAELLDLYQDAPQNFLNTFTQEVDSRTFMTRTGDMTWEEVAEMEHARTGTLDHETMAFSVKSYARSLGYSREFVEDNTADQLRAEMQTFVDGADDKQFEILFDTFRNGIADGSELWYQPQPYAGQSFSNTHDHTYVDTNELFGDTNTHTLTEHIREANKDLREHGKSPAIGVLSHDAASKLRSEKQNELKGEIPEAEALREDALPELDFKIDGTRFVQTAWLNGDESQDVYILENDTPIKTNTVRPTEITDNTGATIAGAGGSYGDPGALLGAYGSFRMGAKMADPLAGVKFTYTNI